MNSGQYRQNSVIIKGKVLRKERIMSRKTTKSSSGFDGYLFGMLIALECLMSVTFLGYIHVPPISITIAYIPILIAADLWGVKQALFISLIFGLSSLYKASASYVMEADRIFSPFQSGAPLESILLSVGTRVLFGLLMGILFLWAKKSRYAEGWKILIAVLATRIHAVLVFEAMSLFFPDLGYRTASAVNLSVSDILVALLCVISVKVSEEIYFSKKMQKLKSGINQSENNPYVTKKNTWFFYIFEAGICLMAVLATGYFAQRASYMLGQHGVVVDSLIKGDLLHLQIQFLIAVIALSVISILLLICIYRYMAYREYLGEMDGLTGVMGRKMFLYYCNKIQEEHKSDSPKSGWFLLMDVDFFKIINDTYGHPIGDIVLKEVASSLKEVFEGSGQVGRVGGDEFAVIVETEMSKQELGERLDRFLREIAGILPDWKISSSIGGFAFVFPKDIQVILKEADKALYQAKENGRAGYVLDDKGI